MTGPVTSSLPSHPKYRPRSWFKGAKWIWYAPEAAAPKAGHRYFRKVFNLPADVAIKGTVSVTGDNSYSVALVGKEVTSGTDWATIHIADVSSVLKAGPNTVTADVTNVGDDPAVVVVKLQITAGTTITIRSDSTWESSTTPNGPWCSAAIRGDCGIEPWKSATVATAMPMDPPTYFRKDFSIDRSKSRVVKATLFVTAFGSYLFNLFLFVTRISLLRLHRKSNKSD